MEMHEVQEEYLFHPAYQCVPTQEVLQVILMMTEEEMDPMNPRRTRLFIPMMQQDPLANLKEIPTLMVIIVDIHD